MSRYAEAITDRARRMDRRDFLRLSLIGGIAAACGGATQPSPTAPATAAATVAATVAPTPQPTPLSFTAKVAVSHLKSLLSASQWGIGEEKGFFKEVGITHELTEFRGGGDTVRGLLEAGNHYGSISPSATMAAFEKGQPVRIIGGAYGSSTVVFIVRKDSPIASVDDLKGKKIGFSSPGSATHVLATRLDADKALGAQLIPVGGIGESFTALRGNVVDASWSAEPQPSRFPEEFRRLVKAEDIIPGFLEFVLGATESFVKERPDVLTAFLGAWAKTVTFIGEDPKAAAAIWAKTVNLDPAVVEDGLNNLPPGGWTAKLVPSGLKAVAQSMIDAGDLKAMPDWSKLVVQDYLPADLRVTF